MTTKARKLSEKAEAVAQLRKLLRPGDRVYTVLRHVSASGMSRRIDLYTIKKGEPVFLTGYVGKALEYRHSRDGGLVVGGCGMDMGFHLVHSLGYALWGGVAKKGTGRGAVALRRRLLAACRSYLMQGGRTQEPNPELPADEWFGATGYALRHDWL